MDFALRVDNKAEHKLPTKARATAAAVFDRRRWFRSGCATNARIVAFETAGARTKNDISEIRVATCGVFDAGGVRHERDFRAVEKPQTPTLTLPQKMGEGKKDVRSRKWETENRDVLRERDGTY